MSNFAPRIRIYNNRQEIFDGVRKKFVALTPEELVRQQLIHFLIHSKNFPATLLQIETAINYNNKSYRTDIVAYDRHAQPLLIAECKAADVKITQDTFEQIARYNLVLKVPYLLVSNGQEHFFCRFDAMQNNYRFEPVLPNYEELLKNDWK